jgi:hypothetical protein
VYWTCHGAPGVSTGWIVRELERGAVVKDVEDSNDDDDAAQKTASTTTSITDSCSDTDYSRSDESSFCNNNDSLTQRHGVVPGRETSSLAEEKRLWRERMAQRRKRFDNTSKVPLGPYDVVVIFTDSNNFKSAFFPFLLTGQDAEFRQQAVNQVVIII